MKQTEEEKCSCVPEDGGGKACRVESLISVDERGQMVIPKKVRDKAGIKPGDKLALVCWEKDKKICCISLIKADEITDMVKGVIGPLVEEII